MIDSILTKNGRLRLWTTFRHTRPEAVYRAFTEADKVSSWWADEAEISLPAYKLTFKEAAPAAGAAQTFAGTLSENTAPSRLAFSGYNVGLQNLVALIVDIEARDQDTLLTLTLGPLEEAEVEAQKVIWDRWLGNLGRRLERT